MRFSCDECGRSYVAADEVSGRAFRMRCKQCGHEIVVRPAVAAHAATIAAPAPARERRESGRPAFDPFEGQDVAPDEPVVFESLEILDRTPSPIRLPPAPRPGSTPAPARPGTSTAAVTPRPPQAPRVRPGRMLPAEDEEKLGPPGEEGRRGTRRWVIAVALAGLAAAAGILLRR